MERKKRLVGGAVDAGHEEARYIDAGCVASHALRRTFVDGEIA